jgi:GTP-binding protein
VSGASGRDPVTDFDTINQELQLFDPKVAAKPQIVAANKIDALDDPDRLKALEKRVRKAKLPLFRVSAVTGDGVDALLEAVWREIAAVRAADAAAIETAVEDEGVDLLSPARGRQDR